MVDFIITDFSNVRGGGNIIDTVPSAEDFIVDNCTITSSSSGEFVLTPGESLVSHVWLSANKTSITVGESVVFSAYVEDSDGEPLEDLTVSFYRDGVSLGSGVSDDSGLVQLTVSSWSAGSFTCTASCQGVSSSGVTVTVSKVASTISLSAESSSVIVGSDVVLSGTLSVGSGESVKIYQGTTLIDTVTTGTDGAFSKTVSGLSAGTYTFKAAYDGDSTHASAESSTVSVTVGNKPVPTISLGASSSSITVGNNVTMSGQLVYGSTALPNASVKIYNGNTLVDTAYTNSQGYYTKVVSGLTVGTHSFTAVFEGDSSYASVTSTAVSVTVSKITSTISLSAVSSTITVGQSPQLSGTLSVGSGESVKIYLDDTLVDTVTTGTNGAFSFTGSATSTSGSLTFKAVYDGDSTHSSVTSSNVVITVTSAPVVDSVSLTADKSILSYYDSESAVLSATVLDDNDDPMEGETVTFYKGSTSIGTATTNSSGIATKSYSSTGAGDVTFTASAGEVTTATGVTIEDCRYWNDGSSTNGLEIPSGASVTSDGSYLTIASTSSEKTITIPVTLTNSEDWEFSLKLALKQDNKALGLIFNDSTYYMSTNSNVGNYYVYFTSNIYSEVYSATGDVIVVTRKNGTTTVKVNGTQIASKTTSHKSSFKCGFYTFNKPQYVDDLKIKAI